MPALLCITALTLAFAAMWVDRAHPETINGFGWIVRAAPEGARAVLTVIASSMITIASVTFSITVVALTMTSSQFGPRLLRTFMKDRPNQFVLGVFVATFLYALFVLREVTNRGDEPFVPQLSVALAVALAVLSTGALVYFIHHIATSINADYVIASVARELDDSIDRLFTPRKKEKSEVPAAHAEDHLPADLEDRGLPVRSPRSGYLQAVDWNGLVKIGSELGALIKITESPGKYVVQGTAIAYLWPPRKAAAETLEEICDCIYIGLERTEEQDVAYAIRKLVEVAVRALSPGINDPFTAISCIDRLTSSLCRIVASDPVPANRYDESNRLRVCAPAVTAENCIDTAYTQIRQYARNDLTVSLRLLDSIEIVSNRAKRSETRAVLHRHAAAVKRTVAEERLDDLDMRILQERFEEVAENLTDGG